MSSYLNTITYLDLLQVVTQLQSAQVIVEFGILNGHSLDTFIRYSEKTTKIYAYDIFDEFNGNHAMGTITKRYASQPNVSIQFGDFYEMHTTLNRQKTPIDILHIDIANTGDVYMFCIDYYLDLISKNGIIVLEGGSIERDNVEWMIKYNKPKIKTVLDTLRKRSDLIVTTVGDIPSMTIIKRV